MKGKEILSETQAGFRRGMGTIDQVYALNYLVSRQLGRQGGKMSAAFINFRAAFDSVDRGILLKTLRQRSERRFSGEDRRSNERDEE